MFCSCGLYRQAHAEEQYENNDTLLKQYNITFHRLHMDT